MQQKPTQPELKSGPSAERFKQVDNYILSLDKELGRGAYGSVFKGIDYRMGDKPVAVKQISQKSLGSDPEKLLYLLKNEIQNMKMIKHANVVQLLDVRRSSNNIYLIMEYCNQGALDQYLKKNGNWLSETETLWIITQIVCGFKCLYDQKIVHRDLKPANILMHDGAIKIADFGFSKVVHHGMEETFLISSVGSPIYMCPQIFNQQQYSSKADIWSLGIIFYEMIYGRTPWKGTSLNSLRDNINKIELSFPSKPIISARTKKLITVMLDKEEENRVGWEKLFAIFIDKTPGCEDFLNIEEEMIEEIPNSSLLRTSIHTEEEDTRQKQEIEGLKMTQESNRIRFQNNKAVASMYQVEGAGMEVEGSSNKNGINIVARSETEQVNLDGKGEMTIADEKIYMEQFQHHQEIDKQKQIIEKIGQWVLHRRNKAVFLNVITLKFYDLMDSRALQMQLPQFYSVMFVLSKYQTMIIYRIYMRLQTKMLEKEKKKFTADQWRIFVKSDHRVQLLNFIKKDLDVIKQFFEELMKKATAFFENALQSKTLSAEEEVTIRKIQKICNKSLLEKPEFDPIYAETLTTFYQFIKKYIADQDMKNEQDVMAFLMHIHNAVDIRNIFKYQREPRFDFMKYYENVAKAPASFLTKCLYQQQA